MFRGSSFHTIDAKGRIIVPVRFRSLIQAGGGNGVMVSKLDNGLVAYPFDEWSRIENSIMSAPQKDELMRRFIRVFIGSAAECFSDKQERILIPPPLRHYAGLEKEIVLVGVLTHFEIRSRENWDKENAQQEDDMTQAEVGAEIAKLLL
ncbi:MraZ protein [Desulfosarcina sp. BuS5]|uniref:division/cell wall cluster transcriptional repressor MraZ n=1 Tax=Desulfosarcina sp. BuS5 TaxID=933262 RepID=UPI0004817299|nr:division/cell wall cluster transcriptional repressor MraZ [Desulfosarcina sp. BuS5]WDN88092.1 MraZ protein [Desulfosarcina sp. BuS5]